MKNILNFIGRLLYKFMGWSYDDLPGYFPDKCVVIGFPHTTNMDTIRALTYMKIVKVHARLLIKSNWFFPPMSILLKSLGGMPVKRDKENGFVVGVVKEFKKQNNLVLAMVPEGTRKNVSSIKTGFWYIAKGADVPIICWYLDNKAKKTRWLGKIEPGETLANDLLKIQKIYKDAGFIIPLGDLVP